MNIKLFDDNKGKQVGWINFDQDWNLDIWKNGNYCFKEAGEHRAIQKLKKQI